MPEVQTRREFVKTSAGGVAAAAALGIPHPMRPPRPLPPASCWAAKPVIVASENGLRGVQKAYDLILRGADPLDAVVEAVKIEELDPDDDSVGYGGLPNADGVVQLDASSMHGPTRRAGAAKPGMATGTLQFQRNMIHARRNPLTWANGPITTAQGTAAVLRPPSPVSLSAG